MDCLTVRENINAYIDRELSEVESRSVAAHIESCKSCKHEYDAYSLTRAFIADHSPSPSPPGLSESIRIMMEKERLIPKRRFFPRIKRTNTLLAASIALAVVTGAVLMNTIDFKLPVTRGGEVVPRPVVITKVVPAPAEKAMDAFAEGDARSEGAPVAKVIVSPGAEPDDSGAGVVPRRLRDAGVKESHAAAAPKAGAAATRLLDGRAMREAAEADMTAAATRDGKAVAKGADDNVARKAVADNRTVGAGGKASGAGSGVLQGQKPAAARGAAAPSYKKSGGTAQARKTAAGIAAPGALGGYVSVAGDTTTGTVAVTGKDIPVVAEEKKDAAAVAASPAPAAKAKKDSRPGRINVPLPTIAQYPQTGGQQRNFVTPEQMLAMTSNVSGAMTEDYLFPSDRAGTAESAPRGEAVSASSGAVLSYDKDLLGGYYTGYGAAGAAADKAAPDTVSSTTTKGDAAKTPDKSDKKSKSGEGGGKKLKDSKKEDKGAVAAATAKAAAGTKSAKPPLNMTVKVRVKDPEKARALAIKNITAKGGTVVEKDGKIIMSMPASDTLANLKSVRAGAADGSQITVPEKLLNNESRDAAPRTVNTEIIFVTEDKDK